MKHETVHLTDEDIMILKKTENTANNTITKRCKILMALDANHGSVLSYEDIMNEFKCSRHTISTIKREFIDGGVEKVISRKERVVLNPFKPKKRFSKSQEDWILNRIQNPAPTKSRRWSIRLLKKEFDMIFPADHVSRTTLSRFLSDHNIDLNTLDAKGRSKQIFHETERYYSGQDDDDTSPPNQNLKEDLQLLEQFCKDDDMYADIDQAFEKEDNIFLQSEIENDSFWDDF